MTIQASRSPERKTTVSATKLLINNRWIESESGKTFITENPATGTPICRVSEAECRHDRPSTRRIRRDGLSIFGSKNGLK
jgi:hypothetical protein